jgi:hypothetical protein
MAFVHTLWQLVSILSTKELFLQFMGGNANNIQKKRCKELSGIQMLRREEAT